MIAFPTVDRAAWTARVRAWATLARSDIRHALSTRRGKAAAAAILLALVGITAFWLLFVRDLPSADSLLSYEPPLPTNVRAYDGTPAYSFARERRVELPYADFPEPLIHAFISAEDKDFFTHHGIDYFSFGRGVFEYFTKMGSGKRARGGSTITQQVAKNLLVGDEYSPTRKIKEAILAFRIEDTLSKQEILELYLNQISLGRNAYGVQSAARAYFGKDVGELSLPETAYLAVLPRAPSNYSPERHADRAVERRAYVLREMRANGYITPGEQAAADAAPLGTIPRSSEQRDAERAFDGYYMEEVRRELMGKYGEDSDAGPHSIYDGGLWVRTSFVPKVQQAAEQALRDGLTRYEGGRGWSGPMGHVDVAGDWRQGLSAAAPAVGYPDWHGAVVLAKDGGRIQLGFENGRTGDLFPWGASGPRRGVGGRAYDFIKPGDVIAVKKEGDAYVLRTVPQISGGMVVENTHTGQVMAMQGGFDSRGGAFNRATQAYRQPGSTFKPFVYASGLDNGMTPATIVVDGPLCVIQSASLGQKCFRNFSGGFAGPQTMRWGIEQSRNLMTLRVASQTGMDKVVATAKAMGIGSYPPYLAYALGAGETTVLKLTNAYAMLANNGRRLTPTLIDYVQDRHGKVIFRADTRPCEGCNAPDWNGKPMPRPRTRGAQAMDPLTAYQTVHIMEGVIQRGTATILRDLGRPMFGKTGTTTGPTNVWFVGGSADMVGGVYLGYDKPRPLGGFAQGGTIAAPIFKQFALTAFKDMPVVPFRAPAGIRMVRIDRKSGRKVFGTWPTNDPLAPVIWEAFKPESEPRRTIRREEVAKAAARPQPHTGSGDSDFLQSQGGIY